MYRSMQEEVMCLAGSCTRLCIYSGRITDCPELSVNVLSIIGTFLSPLLVAMENGWTQNVEVSLG